MGKLITTFLIMVFIFISSNFAKDIITTKYYKDINNDGKSELIVHDFIGGTGTYGVLTIYNDKGQIIFKENVQGDPYLEDPRKHILSLNPLFFKDIDKDGVIEILTGQHDPRDNASNYDAPWKFKVYKWNGKKYECLHNRSIM